MVSPAGTLVTRPLGLSEAVKNSTALWQDDLQHLFNNAKDRFPDVVWEVTDPESNGNNAEEVWGHKGETNLCIPIVVKAEDSRQCHSIPYSFQLSSMHDHPQASKLDISLSDILLLPHPCHILDLQRSR